MGDLTKPQINPLSLFIVELPSPTKKKKKYIKQGQGENEQQQKPKTKTKSGYMIQSNINEF